MSAKKIVIYSSASGGIIVQKRTTEMINMVRTISGKEPNVVFLDAEPAERQTVWTKSGKKGVYPLLFVDDNFIGDFEEVEGLNEEERLHEVLGVPGPKQNFSFSKKKAKERKELLKTGNLFSQLWTRLFGQKEVRILILGLDSAGKTTILYRLHCGEVITTIPTIGFNVEVVQNKNVKFQVWDLGGQDSIRPYWRCYYSNTDAIVFVVDSADRQRMETARDELHSMLSEEELKDAVLLVFANKQDLPGAMTDAEVSDSLGLPALRERQWAIFKSSAIKGTGLMEGLDWLTNAIVAQNH